MAALSCQSEATTISDRNYALFCVSIETPGIELRAGRSETGRSTLESTAYVNLFYFFFLFFSSLLLILSGPRRS
jgi:hypothetical protein